MLKPVSGLQIGEPVGVLNVGVDHVLQLAERLSHHVDVVNVQEHQLSVLIGVFTFVTTPFHLRKTATTRLAQKCQGDCFVWSWKSQTLLAAALTLGLASKMKSLWDWALASMIAWRNFSSSLLRFPFTPTMGWLQRVTVAWLSGWIHDSTCHIKCHTISAQVLHHRRRLDRRCRLTGILPFARKAATLFNSSSGMLTGTTKVEG